MYLIFDFVSNTSIRLTNYKFNLTDSKIDAIIFQYFFKLKKHKIVIKEQHLHCIYIYYQQIKKLRIPEFKMNDVMDKSMRSVFVGNIPYEVTEDKLKDIFSEVIIIS